MLSKAFMQIIQWILSLKAFLNLINCILINLWSWKIFKFLNRLRYLWSYLLFLRKLYNSLLLLIYLIFAFILIASNIFLILLTRQFSRIIISVRWDNIWSEVRKHRISQNKPIRLHIFINFYNSIILFSFYRYWYIN